MQPARLPIEIEVSPRFEIFYALHALFAAPAVSSERWQRVAWDRLDPRVNDEARRIAPAPLMWAILADSTLHKNTIDSFDSLIGGIGDPPPEEFERAILGGVFYTADDVAELMERPQSFSRVLSGRSAEKDVLLSRLGLVPFDGTSAIAGAFNLLLRDPAEYRGRLIGVLNEFWSRGFSGDYGTVQPELRRMARQLQAANANARPADVGRKLGIPVAVGRAKGEVTAGRGGYRVPLGRLDRIVVLPSAFNLAKWWTKRDTGSVPARLYFPVHDGTVVPNDTVPGARSRATAAEAASTASGPAVKARLKPELVFRALGDTTRYAIATILARAPTTPTNLARQLKVSKPTITHHIHALRDAGLIAERAKGGMLELNRVGLEQLSAMTVEALFASEGKLKLSKTRKRVR